MEFRIPESDFHKLIDPMRQAYRFHKKRDEMNAELHMAPTVRFSPLTSELEAALDRADHIIQEQGD